MLNPYTQLYLQLFKLKVREKIKLRLKNHVLDELVKIFDIQININNFINLVKFINCNFYERGHIYQQQANQYNLMTITT